MKLNGQLGRRKQRYRRGITLVTLVIVAGYTASALITAGPATPIQLRYQALIDTYMQPHFPQNWNLFAPDPISDERGAVVKARCTDSTTTEYLDITTPAILDVQQTRVFPPRESRIISNAMLERMRQDESLERMQSDGTDENSGKSNKELIDDLSNEQTERQKSAEKILARYSMSALSDECRGTQVEQVKIRYVIHKFPGWSHRTDSDKIGKIDYFDSEWVDV